MDLSFVDDELRKRGVDPVNVAAALSFANPSAGGSRPKLPAATMLKRPAENPEAPTMEMQAPAPSGLSFATQQPSQPAKPPLSFSDRYAAEEANAPTSPGKAAFGWTRLAKALGVGALGGGRAGMAEYQRPNVEAQQKFEQDTKQHEQRLEGIKEQAGLENTASQIRERDARTAAMQEPADKVGTTPDAVTLHDLMTGENGQPRTNPQTGKPYTYLEAYGAVKQAAQDVKPDKAPVGDKKIDEWVDENNNRVNRMERPDGSRYNEVVGKERAPGVTAGAADVKDVAHGIQSGQIPPEFSKETSYRDRTAITAELTRNGFNLTKAMQDWEATKKYLATLNGSQQTRYRQALEKTKGQLDQVERIYNEWLKAGPSSGWKVFNKASLATAKQLPGRAGDLAHQLESGVADLTSEMGTVYKGGNNSTDESLKLAGKNLAGEWNEQTFKDALKRIRESLGYAENSLKLAPAGVSPGGAYQPEALDSGKGKGGFKPF